MTEQILSFPFHHSILTQTANMQYEPDFRFDVDDSFSMCSQSMTCPSTTTSFSSASSAYDPFTPNSRRSSPNDLSLDFDPACSSFGPSHPVDMTPPSASMKYMFGAIKPEPEQLSFNENILPSTPMKSADGLPRDYEHMLEMNMTPQHSMGSLTPSNSFGMYTISPEAALGPTSFMMTPTQSLSGSEMADHQTWACNNNESPINFFAQAGLPQHDMQPLKLERHSQSPLGRFQLHGPPSPNRMRADRKMMVHEIQRKTTELQRAQIRASKKRAGKSDTATVDVVRRAMCKCDYPDCNKAFRRNEHLKRHKQT